MSIESKVENLIAASRKIILRWMREGKSFSQILELLSSFQLPAAETSKLKDALKKEMERIAHSAKGMERLEESAVNNLLGLADITLPKIKADIRKVLQKELDRAIRSGIGPEALTRRLRDQEIDTAERVKTLANTSIAQFNNSLTFEQAKVSGSERFLYSGPISVSTRPFCLAHVGYVFTLEQIALMDNGQGLPVREACGGYNCRHEWVAVPDDMTDEEAGGKSAENARPVRVGKMVFMLTEESETRLFAVHRRLYVQSVGSGTPSQPGKVADALAATHDSLVTVNEDPLNEGMWAQRMRYTEKGKTISNYESHVTEHAGREFGNEKNYRLAMNEIVNNSNAEIWEDPMGYIVYDPDKDYILIVNKRGAIETFYKWDRSKRPELFNRWTRIGTLKGFIGEF